MLKYSRNYQLTVEGGDGLMYQFNYPLTLEFYITRAALASANTANLRLYNLNKGTRKAIYKDIYSNVTGTFRSVKLLAGYGDNLYQILSGNIKEAKSFREEGSVNFITEIDAYDWSFAMVNSNSSWVSPSTSPDKNYIVGRLMDDLIAGSPGLGKGFKSDFSGSYSRPFRADGNTWDILRGETNDHCFIDNGLIHCLLDDDCYQGDINVINSTTGLLSTPKKSGFKLKVDVLFEPSMKIGQQVQLTSETDTWYNGTYKVVGIQHTGIISGAMNGKCKTSLELNIGETELNIITGQGINTPVSLSA